MRVAHTGAEPGTRATFHIGSHVMNSYKRILVVLEGGAAPDLLQRAGDIAASHRAELLVADCRSGFDSDAPRDIARQADSRRLPVLKRALLRLAGLGLGCPVPGARRRTRGVAHRIDSRLGSDL
jgi:hypothetical protein